ncbi:MAG: hypothetical protein ABI921_11745 [Panacibacter sp.]
MNSISHYKFLLWFDAILTGIVIFGLLFYFIKGPVSPSVTDTWIFIIMLLAITIIAGVILKSFQHNRLALIPLYIVAAPGILYLTLVLVINVFRIK